MGKTAFLFPGQGVQKNLMCKDFFDASEDVRNIFDISSEASKLNISKLCFEEDERLNITEFTQIALLTAEVAIAKEVMKQGIIPDYSAGLSLGEYASLAISDAMDLKDLFKIIRLRGKYMQEAYPVGGAMTAVLGIDFYTVDKICKEISGNDGEVVSVANDNCPGQIVISGKAESVKKAELSLIEAGAKRCIALNVSGPFHSKLLLGASEKLKNDLEKINLKEIQIPYICNTEARLVTKKDEIKELLVRQISSGVRFRESIILLKEMGVDTFIEIGPQKTISGFIKKIDASLKTINIESYEDMKKLEFI